MGRLVSVAEANSVLAVLEGRGDFCDATEASDQAWKLIGFYPAREVNNPKAYAAGITSLLAAYPMDFVARVVDPVNGLPSRLKWLPALSEIKEALDAEQAKRNRVIANARFVIAEDQRRREEADADAAWRAEQERLTPDERAERAERITAQFRANAMAAMERMA